MAGLILNFAAVLALDVFFDWFVIVRKNRRIKHTLETAGVLLIYLGTAAAHTFYFELITWQDAATVCIVFPSIRWVFHDLFLNLARSLPWDYTGTEQQSAAADGFLNRLAAAGWSNMAVKLAFFGVSALLAAGFYVVFNT